MNRKTILTLTLIFILTVSSTFAAAAKAQTDETTPTPTDEPATQLPQETAPMWPEVYQIRFPQTFNLYTHVRVSVSYAYSTNYTGSVPSATYGTMPYVSGSPTSETFDTDDVGVYMFHVSARYDRYTPQTVTVTFFSENATAAGAILNVNGSGVGSLGPFTYFINTKGFDLDISVSASIAPHAPTADEIADAQRGWWQSNIDNMTKLNSDAIGTSQAYTVYTGAFGVAAFFLVVFFYIRDRKKSQQIATLDAKVELLQRRRT